MREATLIPEERCPGKPAISPMAFIFIDPDVAVSYYTHAGCDFCSHATEIMSPPPHFRFFSSVPLSESEQHHHPNSTIQP